MLHVTVGTAKKLFSLPLKITPCLFFMIFALLLLPVAEAGSSALSDVERLWADRAKAEQTDAGIALLESLRDSDPGNYEIRWRLARFHYWKSSSSHTVDKAMHGRLGWIEAEYARKIRPSGVEGHYWSAICVGMWSEGIGLTMSISNALDDKFEDAAGSALRISREHDGGGPMRVMGRYYATLPWPFRNFQKAESLLKGALAVDQKSAPNLYFMADLELQRGNPDRAKEFIDRIISLNPSGLELPTVRRYQRLAKLMSRGFEK
jgi:tetratricopeptide (TPR) repeat protein